MEDWVGVEKHQEMFFVFSLFGEACGIHPAGQEEKIKTGGGVGGVVNDAKIPLVVPRCCCAQAAVAAAPVVVLVLVVSDAVGGAGTYLKCPRRTIFNSPPAARTPVRRRDDFGVFGCTGATAAALGATAGAR